MRLAVQASLVRWLHCSTLHAAQPCEYVWESSVHNAGVAVGVAEVPVVFAQRR